MTHRFSALMSRVTVGATLALGLAAGPVTANAAPYQLGPPVSSALAGGLTRSEWNVTAGTHPLDRFKLVRIARTSHPASLRQVLMFLPPLGVPFSFYEQRDPNGAPGSSIAEFFALRGYDVWGVSPRFEGIPAGSCEARLLDCSVMAQWNLASMVEDISFVRGHIAATRPGVPVVLGGASLGSMLAIATVDAHPTEYAGAILWEGLLNTNDPAVLSLNAIYCAGLEGQLAGGIFFDAVGGGVFKQVSQLADTTPGGLTPIPLFPPFLTNHQVLVTVLSTPTPGPVSMPVPGYIQMNGSPLEDRLFFASEPRVFDNIRRFANYAPVAVIRDISCSLAGLETDYSDGLAAFTGPLLALGGGRAFGPYLDDQLTRFGSTDVRLLIEPDFGHIDHFMTARHRDVVERPILDWLQHIFH